jgi:hypothetical protein
MFDAASHFAKGFGMRRRFGALETNPSDAKYAEEKKPARHLQTAYR